MPTVFRTMRRDENDGLPVVGDQSKMLGVRIPPNPDADVDIDESGNVVRNGKGMSVAAGWRLMLPHLIPRRLKAEFQAASGSNNLACFRIGTGEFSSGQLYESLKIVLKNHNLEHGNIVPAGMASLQQFQDFLASTRTLWQVAET